MNTFATPRNVTEIKPNKERSNRPNEIQKTASRIPTTYYRPRDRNAEIAIIRFVPIQAFSKEICTLRSIEKSEAQDKRQRERRKKIEVKRSSSIYRVSPFLHRDVLATFLQR